MIGEKLKRKKRVGWAVDSVSTATTVNNHSFCSPTLIEIEQSATTRSPSFRLSSCKHETSEFAAGVEPIDDFCSILTDTGNSRSSCYGLLVDQQNRRHRVWPPAKPLCLVRDSISSLEDLFREGFRLTTKQRLGLSVQLVSSVLQLHSSGWLADDWGRKDIFFFKQNGVVVVDSPMVRWVDHRVAMPTTEECGRSVVKCNQSLLSLGIILIELHYGMRLEECRGPGVGVRGKFEVAADDQTRHDIAWNLVDFLYDDAGHLYSDAVRRCVRGLDHRESSFEKEGFKQEVIRMVLCPLETNLRRFLGNE